MSSNSAEVFNFEPEQRNVQDAEKPKENHPPRSVVMFIMGGNWHIARVHSVDGGAMYVTHLGQLLPQETPQGVSMGIHAPWVIGTGVMKADDKTVHKITLTAIPMLVGESRIDQQLVQQFKQETSGIIVPSSDIQTVDSKSTRGQSQPLGRDYQGN